VLKVSLKYLFYMQFTLCGVMFDCQFAHLDCVLGKAEVVTLVQQLLAAWPVMKPLVLKVSPSISFLKQFTWFSVM
jgi:hypothetical protein